jgi:hypothetical protein
LLRDLAALVARDRATTAELLAHLAEVDARQLYLPAGYPSMYAWCVGELRLSEEAAFKRIHAARTARRFPAIFTALAAGRLHLSAIVLLAPHLTPETTDELLGASTHRSKSEIEQLLAERFPRPELPTRLEAIATPTAQVVLSEQHAPGRVELSESPKRDSIEAAAPRPRLAPIAPERYALQLTVSQSTHDKLRYAQALLSHQIPSGDLARVLDRVLDAAIAQFEKRKFAATKRPGRAQRSSRSARHVPAHVKRAVWQRDQGQCTFVSESGHRCPARKFLEFDHVNPVSCGGEATANNLRLRCRAHNQYAAESTFGAEFMSGKRQEARRVAVEAGRGAAEARRAAAEVRARARAEEQAKQLAKSKAAEVIPWLRQLGFRPDEAQRAAERCEGIPDASLEDRVRAALSYLSPRTASRGRVASASCGP